MPPPRPVSNSIAIERHDAVDSTNRVAAEAIRAGRLGGPAAFVAREQHAGQGREGRTWHSPPGGLWCTLAWPLDAAEAPRVIDGLGLRLGVACLRAVRAMLDPAAMVQLKWPNDILIDGHKVCGCLGRAIHAPPGAWLLLGVGINVNNDPEALGPRLRRPATSLARARGGPLDLDAALERLLAELILATTSGGLPPEWLAEARAALFGVGARIEAREARGGLVQGVLEGIDNRGDVVISDASRRSTLQPVIEMDVPAPSGPP